MAYKCIICGNIFHSSIKEHYQEEHIVEYIQDRFCIESKPESFAIEVEDKEECNFIEDEDFDLDDILVCLSDDCGLDLKKLRYKNLLSYPEWKFLRERILARDHHKCVKCGKTERLNVHHNYYVKDKKPWEYSDDVFVTLCVDCHCRIHDLSVYDHDPLVNPEATKLSYETCNRCGGSGYIPEFNHIEDGICFACLGSGYKNLYWNQEDYKTIE